MYFFLGMLALVAVFVLGLVFTADITTTVIFFGPFVLLGAAILIWHYRSNNVFEQAEGGPVFTEGEEEPEDRAA